MSKRPPTRSCICCRRQADKGDLLRFVLSEGQIVWDMSHKMPGRGAYVHPMLECWLAMASPKMWERAFRLEKGAICVDGLKGRMDEIRSSVEELSGGAIPGKADSKIRL